MPADTELRIAVEMTNIRQLRRVTSELKKVGKTSEGVDRVGDEAEQAGRQVEQMGRFAKFTLNVLEAFLLYKGFVFLKTQAQEFTRELVNLQNQVAIIQTQLGDVPQNFEPLVRGEIIDTAERTGASLETLSEAQFSIVSANIALEDSFAVLDETTKAAVAGGLDDVNVAVQSVLTQMNAFGREAEDTNEILDKQFNLVRRGIFTYEQFARVSGMVSVAFAGIGQDLETANAALATVSQIFTGGQIRFGATALRNLANAIGKNSEEFEELGVAVFDEEGNFRNFVDIMRDLRNELEGLSEEQRFEALRQIFPNKRELRGAISILERLPEMEQFFVEQQFAVGDLDRAYDNVSESLKTQAGILRNEMIPAVEPVLLLFEDLLNIVNTLNEAIPGFTRALLQAAAAFAAVKAAGLASTTAGGVGAATSVAGGGAIASRFAKRPTGLGLALAGGVGAGVFETGRNPEPGFDRKGLLGSVAAGGATGAVLGGGPAGAAAGAAISAGVFALGEHFEEEAPKVAEAWNDRFREAVLEEGEAVGRALSNTIAEEVGGQTGQDIAERVQNVISGPLQFEQLERRRVLSRSPLGTPGNLFRNIQSGLGPAFGFDDAGTELVTTGSRQVNLREGIVDAISTAEDQRQEIRALSATGVASEETIRGQVVEVAFEDFVQGLGELTDENEKQVETARNVVEILSNFEAGTEEARDALNTLEEDGLEAFLDQLEGAAAADLPEFRGTIADFRKQVAFDANEVSNALEELGLGSNEVASEFGELTRTLQAFEFIETFRTGGLLTEQQANTLTQTVAAEAGMPGEGGLPTQFTPEQVDQLGVQMVEFVRGEIEEEVESPLEEFGLATLGAADTMNAAQSNIEEGLFTPMSLAGESLSRFAHNFQEFNQRIQAIQLIEEILGVAEALNLSENQVQDLNDAIVMLAEDAISGADTGFFEGDPQEIADRVFEMVRASQAEQPDTDDEIDIPSSTSLDRALQNTADSINRGLLTSTEFTSHQLEEMGNDIAVFNKQLRKIELLEEIARVADLAGQGINLTSTIQTLIQDLTVGGETLATLIQDPERLADLIATAEFREVNIDKSDRRTFAIRVSSDIDPSRAAEIADSIKREMNNDIQREVPS